MQTQFIQWIGKGLVPALVAPDKCVCLHDGQLPGTLAPFIAHVYELVKH